MRTNLRDNLRLRLFSLLLGFCWWVPVSINPAVAAVQKPAKTVLLPGHDPGRIAVKFRDGLNIRLRNNALISTNAQMFTASRPFFASLASGTWERADAVSEDTLDQLRSRAEQQLGHALPDLNLQFYLTLPPGLDAASVIDRLNQLDIVELAEPVPRFGPPPLPPNFEPQQTSYNPAPVGDGVFGVWTNYAVFGSGVRVVDLEYSYNPIHSDLPAIINLDTTAVDPFHDNNHGTATLGEVSALENGWGATGIARAAAFYFVGVNYPAGYDVGRALTTALSHLRAGDVILIEQQVYGPNSTQDVMNNGGQYGMVPVEWYKPYYDRIVTAVASGIIVVEAAANGGQNLDDPIYSTGNGGHWPFLPQNNSGAIIVGAGASFQGSSTESSRLGYSDYGSRVDVQNWGENIITTGYGDLYYSEGANLYYTSSFGGTSGSTPLVVGEAALLESIYQNVAAQPLTPSQVKNLLRNTGSPQTGGAYPAFENIGPLPNLSLAVKTALSNIGPPVIVQFTTNVSALVGGTATLTVAASGAQPMAFQWQFNHTNLVDGPGISGSGAAALILNSITAAESGNYSVAASNSSGTARATAALLIVPNPAFTPGVTVSNVYTFTGSSDGSGSVGLTPDGLGNLYGVQEYGGAGKNGIIYKFTPATSTFSVLYSFTSGYDGANPVSPLLLGEDGNLYGTTSQGSPYYSGAIFSIDPYGDFTTLYTFTGYDDGGMPQGTLAQGTDGLFYGTAYYGGSVDDYGVVFKVDSSGNYNVIHTFDGTHGGGPYGGLVLASDGNFYGTTDYGGTNDYGTIFRIKPDGTFLSLFSFNNANGSTPSDTLVQAVDGKLYGRTYYGGAYGKGTLYSITTNSAFHLLFSFNGTNGANPSAALFSGNDGNLYGLTQYGGTNGRDGVIYEITPGGWFGIVAQFNGRTGISPYAPIVRGGDGNLYGTTFSGGYGDGVIFKLSFASTPAPTFQSITTGNTQFNLTWSAVPGRSYQLQSTTNLSQPGWNQFGSPLTATNAVLSASDLLPQTGQKFYKLSLAIP